MGQKEALAAQMEAVEEVLGKEVSTQEFASLLVDAVS